MQKTLYSCPFVWGRKRHYWESKDIGKLASTIEEDTNPEALGIGAEKGVDSIGELCCMKGFHPVEDISTLVSWE